ncbi:MAG: Ig-like domain-containing protein, partial [Methanobacteriaceae archaeon]|nr:Ig-like domain-containing protein [Methanobacteriaceae archaeon]
LFINNNVKSILEIKYTQQDEGKYICYVNMTNSLFISKNSNESVISINITNINNTDTRINLNENIFNKINIGTFISDNFNSNSTININYNSIINGTINTDNNTFVNANNNWWGSNSGNETNNNININTTSTVVLVSNLNTVETNTSNVICVSFVSKNKGIITDLNQSIPLRIVTTTRNFTPQNGIMKNNKFKTIFNDKENGTITVDNQILILETIEPNTITTVNNINSSVESIIKITGTVTSNKTLIDGGRVYIKINGKTIGNADIINGSFSFKFMIPSLWSTKNYTITAHYSGINNYTQSYGNGILTLHKDFVTVLLNPQQTTNLPGDKVTFSATVVDNILGRLIVKGTVVFKINGKTMGLVNITNGIASYNYIIPKNFTAKNYNITAYYLENNKFNRGSSENSILTIAKQDSNIIIPTITGKVGQTVNLKATIKNSITDSNVNSGNVVFKLNGKTITNTIKVINGSVNYNYTIPTNLNPKSYVLSVVFSGSSQLNSGKNNGTLIIK